MPDELGSNGIGDAWRNQPVNPVRMSAAALSRKAQRFEAKMRLMFRIALVLVVVLIAGYGSFLYFFPGTLHRIGSGLTIGGLLYGACALRKRGAARNVPSQPASATCAAYRAELERQRDFHLSAWRRLVACVPGPVVFIIAFLAPNQQPAETIAVAAALLSAPFVAGVPLNLRAARNLQREISAVDALMRES